MRRDLLAGVTVYLVTDASPKRGPFDEFLATAIEAGVEMLQLRDRRLNDRELLGAARLAARVCRELGALCIINDRLDIALSAGADGVHLGQDDLDPASARAIAGTDFVIGVSTHSSEQVDRAQDGAADYFAVGPIYATPTKPGRPPVGLDLVRYASANARKPFFAIGGIDPTNVGLVRAAGAKSVSVLRWISQSDDPAAAVRSLREAID
jgi:thiamine-phosphate pyrophosphorylase